MSNSLLMPGPACRPSRGVSPARPGRKKTVRVGMRDETGHDDASAGGALGFSGWAFTTASTICTLGIALLQLQEGICHVPICSRTPVSDPVPTDPRAALQSAAR